MVLLSGQYFLPGGLMKTENIRQIESILFAGNFLQLKSKLKKVYSL